MSHSVELHLVCGKVAAGKSTFSAHLATQGVVRIEQDRLMASLYPEMETVTDYVRLVPRLRAAVGPLVVDMLKNGISIVLDWPANTVVTRAWMRELAVEASASARLHWLATPDDLCLDRLARRNAARTHDYHVSREEFAQLSAYFEPPSEKEGMEIVRHAPLGT